MAVTSLDLDAEGESESPARRAVLRGGDADPASSVSTTDGRSDVNALEVVGNVSSDTTEVAMVVVRINELVDVEDDEDEGKSRR